MAKVQFLEQTGLVELIAQIKAADKAVKEYAGTLPADATQTNVLDYVLAQIEASKFSGNAADVAIADAGNLITATDVEGALAEIAGNVATISGTGEGSFDKAIKDAIGELKVGETSYATVKAYVDALNAAVLKIIHGETGSLEDLNTTDKSNLVAAINEVAGNVAAVDYSGKADKVVSATSGNFAGLDAEGNLTDSGKKASDFDEAGAAAAVSGYGKGETAKTVKEVATEVATLVGDDTSKSVRTIANEELAKQLIAEGAAESLNTLQEIAAWIQQHPKDAAEMNTNITNLQTQVGKEANGEAPATGLVKDIRDLQAAIGDGGSVANAITNAINELDATVTNVPANGDAPEVAVSITEVDGKLTAVTATVKAETFDAYGAASAVQGQTTKTIKDLEDIVGEGYEAIPTANVTSLWNSTNAKA